MTRPALPAPPQARPGRRLFRWPTLRRSATVAHLIRTEPVVVNPAQLAALMSNPDVQVTHVRPYGTGLAKVMVRYPDRTAPGPKTEPLVRLTVDRQAIRTLREVGTAIGHALTWVLAVGAAATVTGGLIWNLFADQLTAAAKILLIAGGSTVALLALVWLLSAKAGICPGLHCPGCPHH